MTGECQLCDAFVLVYSIPGVPMEPARPNVIAVTCCDAVLQLKRPSVVNGNDIHRYYVRYRQVNHSTDWTYLIM